MKILTQKELMELWRQDVRDMASGGYSSPLPHPNMCGYIPEEPGRTDKSRQQTALTKAAIRRQKTTKTGRV